LGNVTTSVYDKGGNQTATINPLGIAITTTHDALDTVAITTGTAYDAVGNVKGTKDALGNWITYTYGGRAATKVEKPKGCLKLALKEVEGSLALTALGRKCA
jgi:uncharacterized protein RhaS with RHS repeats